LLLFTDRTEHVPQECQGKGNINCWRGSDTNKKKKSEWMVRFNKLRSCH